MSVFLKWLSQEFGRLILEVLEDLRNWYVRVTWS
jgi:hypothetical protein